jgi:hypothetical protein
LKTLINSFLTFQIFLKEQQEVLTLIQLNAIENNYSTRCKNWISNVLKMANMTIENSFLEAESLHFSPRPFYEYKSNYKLVKFWKIMHT